jgi:hypothetical protein
MSGSYEFRDRVISAAMKVVQARLYADLNPGSSASIADVEYAEDEFDVYVRGYADVLESRDN